MRQRDTELVASLAKLPLRGYDIEVVVAAVVEARLRYVDRRWLVAICRVDHARELREEEDETEMIMVAMEMKRLLYFLIWIAISVRVRLTLPSLIILPS